MSKVSSLFFLIFVLWLSACAKDPSQGPVAAIKSPNTAVPPTPLSVSGAQTTTTTVNGKVVTKPVHHGHPRLNHNKATDDDDAASDDTSNDLDTSDTGAHTPAQAAAESTESSKNSAGNAGGAATPPRKTLTRASKMTIANQINYVDDNTAYTQIKQAKDLLNQFPSGKKYAADLERNLVIKLGPPEQVNAIADLSGATFLIVDGSPARIVASSKLSAADLAHVLAYEAQKISDETAERNFLKTRPDFKALVQSSRQKYNDQGGANLQASEQSAVMFYESGLFCGEARAFNRNLALVKEGLPYSLDILRSSDLGTMVSQYFLAARQLPQLSSIGDLTTLTTTCLNQSSVVDFQLAVAPPATPAGATTAPPTQAPQ